MIFAVLISAALSYTERAVPSWWLNNWDEKDPVICFWTGQQDSWTIAPEYRPGVHQVRAFDDLKVNILTDDSFAVVIDGAKFENMDPMLLNSSHLGGAVQEKTGELWTEYDSYNGAAMPVKIRKSYFMVPHTRYYTAKYTVTSADGSSHTVKILDFLSTDSATEANVNGNVVSMKQADRASVAVLSGGSVIALGRGFGTNESVLDMFNNDTLVAGSALSDEKVTYGSVFELAVPAEGSAVAYAVRAVGRTIEDALSVIDAVKDMSLADIEQATAQGFSDWLNSGTIPKLSEDALDLFYKSLLVLKNSQNPKLGTISSSLHNRYGYKNWMRDASMAAFMLDAAGFHNEFKKFVEWSTMAPLDDKGGFHTSYNALANEIAWFVEPQYDGNGILLLALNYHYQCFGDKQWVASKMPALRRYAEIYMREDQYEKLVPPDYAPWEESSDHHSGDYKSTRYYTFTQGLAYGGLIALAKLEEQVGVPENAQKYLDRAAELKDAINRVLWDDENKHYHRSVYFKDGVLINDTIADGSTLSVIFTGMTTTEQAQSHLAFTKEKLTHLENGLSRYENDPYFFDSIYNPCGAGNKETQRNEPVWPVTTAYAAWSEDVLGIDYQGRLDWMVKYAAYGNMPIGESVDAADGALVVPSAPDCFEHGGVYVFTTLLKKKMIKSILATLQ